MRIAILDDYQRWSEKVVDLHSLSPRATFDVFDRSLGLEEGKEILRPYDALCLMRERMSVPADLIDALPNLKLISITGRQNRTLDLEAATRRAITVCYSEGGSASLWNTAELAWGLLLAVAREIPAEDRSIRAGRWQSGAGLTLHGRRLGVVGFGRIGRQVANYGQSFGMNVCAWSPNLTAERTANAGVTAVDKDELFSSCDAISIHLVLSRRTEGVIGAADLLRINPGGILINTSRAALVNQDVLIQLLRTRRIRAGMDVFPQEPLPSESVYKDLPNCVLTPHVGYVTTESMADFYRGTLEVIEAFLNGAPIRRLN